MEEFILNLLDGGVLLAIHRLASSTWFNHRLSEEQSSAVADWYYGRNLEGKERSVWQLTDGRGQSSSASVLREFYRIDHIRNYNGITEDQYWLLSDWARARRLRAA